MDQEQNGTTRRDGNGTGADSDTRLTQARSLRVLRIELARAYRDLPADAKPIASNLMQILKNWDEHENPERHFRRQYAEFMRRMAA